MAEVKFCKDCKHAKPVSTWFGPVQNYKYATCHREEKHWLNLVTGETEKSISSRYCSTERDFDCGPEAKYWEPK